MWLTLCASSLNICLYQQFSKQFDTSTHAHEYQLWLRTHTLVKTYRISSKSTEQSVRKTLPFINQQLHHINLGKTYHCNVHAFFFYLYMYSLEFSSYIYSNYISCNIALKKAEVSTETHLLNQS